MKKKTKGFTLLELLVASTIFAAVVIAAYSLFRAGREMVETGERRSEVLQTARAALRQMESDLRAAKMSGSVYDTGLVGNDEGDEELPLDEIEMVGVNHHVILEHEDKAVRAMDLSRVSYLVDEYEGLVRRRTKVLHQSVIRKDDDEENELISARIVGLNLRYFDGTWKESWDSTRSETLPRAIEITVWVQTEEDSNDVLEKMTTRVYLPLWQKRNEQEQQ